MPGQANIDVAREIEALADLPRDVLVDRWTDAYGRKPPKSISRRLLVRSAAYQIQATRVGKLKPKTRRLLHKAADQCEPRQGTSSKHPPSSRTMLRPGMRLVREWNGKTHSVDVIADGLMLNGVRYRSLSAVALAITGARWSGPRFFGL